MCYASPSQGPVWTQVHVVEERQAFVYGPQLSDSTIRAAPSHRPARGPTCRVLSFCWLATIDLMVGKGVYSARSGDCKPSRCWRIDAVDVFEKALAANERVIEDRLTMTDKGSTFRVAEKDASGILSTLTTGEAMRCDISEGRVELSGISVGVTLEIAVD